MSLRVLHIQDLKALASRNQDTEAFAARLREVIVDRHPATLDPDEFDPIDSVCIAWEESGKKAAAAFENVCLTQIHRLVHAWSVNDASLADAPFALQILRLLHAMPLSSISDSRREEATLALDGLIIGRERFEVLFSGTHFVAALRLCLRWKASLDESWLESIFRHFIEQKAWSTLDGAPLPVMILDELAYSAPTRLTASRLRRYWAAAYQQTHSHESQEQTFYALGKTLRLSPAGQEQLCVLFASLPSEVATLRAEGHLSPHWNFLPAVAELYYGDPRKEKLVSQPTPLPTARTFPTYRSTTIISPLVDAFRQQPAAA